MMKKFLCSIMAVILCLAMMQGALASTAPSVGVSKTALRLHFGEDTAVKVTIKNLGDLTYEVSEIKSSKETVLSASDVTVEGEDEKGFTLRFTAGSEKGSTTIKVKLLYSDNRGAWLTFTVRVAEDFEPQINWYHILVSDAGFPQIKVSMTDDNELYNVCYVRDWTDENGIAQEEIYAIHDLRGSQEEVRFCSIKLPGSYWVQVNDAAEKTHRFNSKVLLTVLDTDGDGEVDAFYTTDPDALTYLPNAAIEPNG